MKNSRLVSAVEALSDTEVTQFHKFVNSPFFNKNTDVIHLFQVLAVKRSQPQISKQEVFEALFPNVRFNDLKLRHVSSNLLKVLEKYLAIKRFSEDKFTQQYYLLEELNHRNLDRQFRSLRDRMQANQDAVKFKSQDFYYNQFRLESEWGNFIEKQQDRSQDPNLAEKDKSLDLHYIIQKLKLACTIQSYKNIMDSAHEQEFIDHILEKIQAHSYGSLPAVRIYFNGLMTLKEPDESGYFTELKKLLIDNVQSFPLGEAGDIFILARNYCIKKVNDGHYDYFQPLYDLYLLDLKNGSLLEDGFISPFSYKNIVSVGLKLRDFEGVERFIHDYKDHLEPEFRDTIYPYNLAKYHFSMRQYNDVISLLHHTEYNEIFVNIDSKVMLLKTFFELDEIDPLYSLMESFRVYLKRKRKLSYHRTAYLNFIRILKKITTTSPGDDRRIGKITEEINATPKVVDKDWLLEKLNGIG